MDPRRWLVVRLVLCGLVPLTGSPRSQALAISTDRQSKCLSAVYGLVVVTIILWVVYFLPLMGSPRCEALATCTDLHSRCPLGLGFGPGCLMTYLGRLSQWWEILTVRFGNFSHFE